VERYQQVARRSGRLDTLARDLHGRSTLCPGWNLDLGRSIQRRDRDDGTRCSLRVSDGDVDREIPFSLAVEYRVYTNMNCHEEVACGSAVRSRFAFALDSDPGAIGNTVGNLDLDGPPAQGEFPGRTR